MANNIYVIDGAGPANLKLPEKKDYSLPKSTSMEDKCYCVALCATSCARKKCPMEVIYTVSDFSDICTKYRKEKDGIVSGKE